MAEKLFVSWQSISNWENNKTMPDIENLIRIAKLIGFSLDNLLVEGAAIVKDIKMKTDLKQSKKIKIIVVIVNLLMIVEMQFIERYNSVAV